MLEVQALDGHGAYVGESVETTDPGVAAMIASMMFNDKNVALVCVWENGDMLYHYESKAQADDVAIQSILPC